MNYLTLALLFIIGLLVIRMLVLEGITIIRLIKFRLKGLKQVEYFFWPYTFIKDLIVPREERVDECQVVKKKMFEADQKEPFTVEAESGKLWFFLRSHEAISEFYKKEIGNTIKQNYFVKLKFLSFFYQNGKEVHEGRSTFAKIFHYSNVVSLMPQIHQSIKNHVNALRKRVAAAKDQRLKINMKEEFLLQLFEDLTGCILLTGADKKIRATFDGMSISQVLKKMFDCFEDHPEQIVAWLPFCEELGLSKPAREFKRLQNGLRKIISDQYKARYNTASEEDLADNSILDIMVKLNKKSERENGKPQFSLEEISDNFEMFQFAGSDTSFQASCSFMTFLAQPENHKYQEKVYSEIKTEEDINEEKLSSLKELNMCFRETMRMANPAPMIVPRQVVKDFKLCGYQLKKGDMAFQFLLQYQSAFFKDPFKWAPERFSEEARKNLPYTMQIPFSHGQRGCIGKYLGEIMVKLIVSEMVKNFKFEVEEGYVMKLAMKPIYGVSNPELILSLRKE